jgi:group II intron reverse transcriptase/maturase
MYEHLMEEVLARENCLEALAAVRRNRGAPGIDRMRTDEFEEHLRLHWVKIREKLLAGRYRPSPVRQVEIPKPGGGVRKLGIPTVLDRFIQHLLVQALTPIYEPLFSVHSYGFRPDRSAHDAVEAARGYARQGKDYVVDFDITAFFDRVNHDILMGRIGQTIRDKRVLRLLGDFLRSGVMVGGVVMPRGEGTPQGGPVSPLLANIYLDALDRELERRGHAFCRYADDCNIYVSSEAAARRVYASIKEWIEQHLRLQLNEAKSGTGRTWERKFLGFRIGSDRRIEVSPESLLRFKDRVRELWRTNQSRTSEQLRDQWRRYVQGWWQYYRLAEGRKDLWRLEPWIRRHIRKCFWHRWHSARGRFAALRRLGVRGRSLGAAYASKGAWRMARSPAIHQALSNARLRQYGFLLPSDLAAS